MKGRRLPLLTFVVAVATGLILAFGSTGSSETCTASDRGPSVCTSESRSLVEENGANVLLVLSVPAVLAAVGVARPTERVLMVVAAALSIAIVPALLTVGLFYVPTALTAWVAYGALVR
jgi:hypothetical protein